MKKVEVEQKYRIASPAGMRRRLKALGAKILSKGREKNELWDYSGIVRRQKSILRLRAVNGKGWLTLKGPRLKSKFKKRVEIETAVDAQAVRTLLTVLGFRVTARYQKFREEYQLGSAHVTVDRLKGFGWFVEIEAAARQIEKLARQLGLTNQHREERTYLEMQIASSRRSATGRLKDSY